jgi:hypothetical protein
MSSITLKEGDFLFQFKDVCIAEKYDEWAHHKKVFQQACGGAKAVDFIVVKNNQLWLIEVKDYRTHPRQKSTDLIDEFAQKVRDTMAGLVAASMNGEDSSEQEAA